MIGYNVLTMNNNPKMIGCDSQTYFLVHCYHCQGRITSSLDLNSIILGKEERKKKWLTLPFIPMNMADIDYSGNGENGQTSITACHRQR